MDDDSPRRRGAGRRGALLQAIGLGCLLAWTNVTFFSRLIHYSTRNDISHLNSTYTFACCGMIAAYLGFALLEQRLRPTMAVTADGRARRRLADVRAIPVCAAVVLAVCTVVLAMVEREFFRQPWCSIASSVAGMASAALMLAWGARLAAVENVAVRRGTVMAAFAVGAAGFVAVLYLPEIAGIAATFLLPLVSLYALFAGIAPSPVEGGEKHPPQGAYPSFARTLVAVSLIGLAESLVRALFLEVDPASDSSSYRWLFLAATCVVVAVLAAAGAWRNDPSSVKAVNRVSMFVLAFLTLLAPIVAGLNLLSDLPALTCYCLFNLLVWIYLTQMARAYRIAPFMLFGLGLAAANAGVLAGTFLGGVLTSFVELSWRLTSLIALLCACLVLVSMLFLADEQTLTTLLDADSERPQAPRRFRLRVEEVAGDYGLTAKETEVFLLAAKGRTTQRIREEMGISTGTVNTHLMHIYKKLGVHDRQQMIDMLDVRAEDEH